MPKPEDILKKQVIDYLNATGTFYLRINSGKVAVKRGWMQMAPEGTADFLICNPHPKWVELKAPGQKTAKARAIAQAAFGERVTALGHIYRKIETLDALKDML